MWTRYSDDQRAAVLAALDANGGNVSRTARELHIPEATIRSWKKERAKPVPRELYEEKVSDLKTGLQEIAAGLVSLAMSKVDEGNADLLDVLKGLGIVVDKLQLLEGKPTERTAVVNEPLTDDERITRAASLFDRARARRAGQTADRPDWSD